MRPHSAIAVVSALRRGGDGWLVAFGVRPDCAETGYGSATSRREAPGTAERYLADGGYAWNSGMFLVFDLHENQSTYVPDSVHRLRNCGSEPVEPRRHRAGLRTYERPRASPH